MKNNKKIAPDKADSTGCRFCRDGHNLRPTTKLEFMRLHISAKKKIMYVIKGHDGATTRVEYRINYCPYCGASFYKELDNIDTKNCNHNPDKGRIKPVKDMPFLRIYIKGERKRLVAVKNRNCNKIVIATRYAINYCPLCGEILNNKFHNELQEKINKEISQQ